MYMQKVDITILKTSTANDQCHNDYTSHNDYTLYYKYSNTVLNTVSLNYNFIFPRVITRGTT